MHARPRLHPRRRAGRRSGRPDGAAPHHQRAGGRRRRPAGRRAELERPDAREGHLMPPASVDLPARTPAQGAGPGAGHQGRDLRRRRRAHRRPPVHRRARRRRSRPSRRLDGHGLKLLAQGGITPLVITGRDSPAVRRRIADLGLPHAVYGAQRQAGRGQRTAARPGARLERRRRDGRRLARPAAADARRLRLCAANAHAEVRAVAHHVTPRSGGARRGARMLRPAADGRRPLRRMLRGHLTTLDAI